MKTSKIEEFLLEWGRGWRRWLETPEADEMLCELENALAEVSDGMLREVGKALNEDHAEITD